ncbi:6341_t:CDS:2 [Paraglomus brasilianum]|uniref:6341_t:CDS:1 n=1 Tax=Paraglomus brasilianum TaxID=144538 RepID=A0A9N8ZFP4_9GLOM|nr:6341_t:CDS:2 [Paraglomus brasilianum]
MFNKILNAYFASLEDFSIDSRGDVGSWVREVGMKSLGTYVPLITRNDDLNPTSPQWWTKDLSMQVVKKLLKQSVERIDKIRACAGTILIDLLYEKRMTGEWVLDINGRSVLERVLNRDEEIHWINPSELYPRMIQLLVLPEYRFDLLAGLVVAAGGMTESLVRYSSATLIKYASSLPPFATDTSSISLLDFANALLEVFRVYGKQDRVVVPLLEVIDLLFEAGALQKGIDCGFDFQELFDKVKKEVSKSRDIRKLSAGVRVYCGFVTLGGTLRTKALQHLLSYLVHPFPKIRRLAADQLYITLTATIVEDEPDEMVEIEEILSTIDWSDPVSKLKEIRDRLYPLLNVPKPTLRIAGDPSASTTVN